MYRRSDIFEHLFALYSAALCSEIHRRQILELLHRAIGLGGGMTLVTRMGLLSWLDIVATVSKNEESMTALKRQLYQNVDAAAVRAWKASTVRRSDTPLPP